METLFCLLGFFVIYTLISMMGNAEELCEFVNDKSKDKKASGNVAVLGCFGILSYAWFFWGFFTSQWFLCLIFFLWSFFSTAFNKLFSRKSHTTKDMYIGALIDLLFVLLIVINCLWLHIDFCQLFMRLF